MANVHAISWSQIFEVTSCLCDVVARGFGPSFQHSVIASGTRKVLITNYGIEILKSTTASAMHPVTRTVLSALENHVKIFGDDSKSFVVLLNELCFHSSRIFTANFNRNKLSSEIQFLRNTLLPLMFSSMDRYCLESKVSSDSHTRRKLILGTVGSHLSEYDASHVSEIFADFLERNFMSVSSDENLCTFLSIVYKYCHQLIVKNIGRSLLTSYALPGFLVSREFYIYNSEILTANYNSIKFIMLSCTIDSISENYDNVEFEIPNVKSDNFQSVIESKSKQTIGFFRKLQHLDVSLIVSTLKFSDLEKSVCSKFGISVIHTVPEEEAHFLSFALSLDILTHTSDDICFGLLEKCEQVTFGSQSYVHLVPRVSRFHSTFILGGVTEGICHQVSNLLVNCLKVIQSALSPGVPALNLSNPASKSLKSQGTSKDYRHLFSRKANMSALASSAPKSLQPNGAVDHNSECLRVIPVGGAFELALHHVINDYMKTQPPGFEGSTALIILRDSILCVPRLIHSNAYSMAKPRWLQSFSSAESLIKMADIVGIDSVTGEPTKLDRLHSFPSKCQLVVDVLTLFQQLLKVDHML